MISRLKGRRHQYLREAGRSMGCREHASIDVFIRHPLDGKISRRHVRVDVERRFDKSVSINALVWWVIEFLQKCSALSGLGASRHGDPRALPWAILLRAFSPRPKTALH